MTADPRGPRRRLRLFRPGGRRTVDEEIAHHLAERVDRLVAEGWDPTAALREAEARFGDVEGIREELMTMETTDRGRRTMMRWVDEMVQDIRYGVRALRRRPAFAAALVLTLGLGIGANTAIFTVADALLLRPLPYRDVDRLVEVSLKLDGTTTVPFLFADQVEPWLDGADFLGAWAYHESVDLVRSDGPEPESIHALAATPELDDLLGAPLRMGRGLADDDAAPGAPGVAILTYGYWSRHGSDPDVLGREIRLDGVPYTVVGVLDRGFKFPVAGTYDLWIPVADDLTAAGRPVGRAEVVGRLAEGTSVETARERADALAASLEESAPHRYGWKVALTPVGQWRANPEVEQAVGMLAGAVGLLLLIALVNGVNLLLTRGTTRLPEMGIRTAIGASRGRLARQVLVEGVVVATVAGAVATALAWGGLASVRSALPDELRFSSVYDFAIEGRTLAFTFVLTFATGLLLGLLPALQAAREGSLAATASGGGAAAGGRRGGRLRNLLVTAEVALSVALLAGAGLLANSFVRLSRVDPGFEPDHLLVLKLGLSETRYPTGSERGAFFHRLEERIEGLPGVAGATVADGIPPGTGFSFGVALQAEGSEPAREQPFWVPSATGDPDYLDVLGIDLLAGRPLTRADAGEGNVLVDAPLARFLWGGESPLGRRFRMGEDSPWMTVVGVVEDVKLMGVDDRQGRYDILRARSDSVAAAFMSVAVRTTAEPSDLIPAVRQAVRELDPQQPVRDLRPASDYLAESIQKPRFLASLMVGLAALALLLAGVGVYGVMAYVVGRRTREMGIRIALGAPLSRVRRGVLVRGMVWAALGTAAGLALALLLDDVVRSLLFGVGPRDPWTLSAGAALMLVVAAAACWMPARRATRVDPCEALRTE